MNRLTVLENNLEFSINLLNYIIDNNKKIHIQSFAINKKNALDSLDNLHKGDILIVDLDFMGNDGLKIINNQKQKRKNMPHIIVITENENIVIKLQGYVHTIIKRPFEFSKLIEVIENVIANTIQINYEKLIKDELSKFDINVTTIGYTYIVEALTLLLEDETLLKDMKNRLYKDISVKHDDANKENVKWTIEKCVKSTVRYTNSNITKSYFHAESRESVTPKLFISTIIDNLKLRIENEMY